MPDAKKIGEGGTTLWGGEFPAPPPPPPPPVYIPQSDLWAGIKPNAADLWVTQVELEADLWVDTRG